MMTTVTSKGQVTIPKQLRDLFHIKPYDKVDFRQEGDKIVLSPVKTLLELRGSVPPKENSNFEQEREVAKKSVGKRVAGEME